MRRVFKTRREEIARKWRELYNEKLHSSYFFSIRFQSRPNQ
jgi:hypothetical protein